MCAQPVSVPLFSHVCKYTYNPFILMKRVRYRTCENPDFATNAGEI